MFDIRALRTIFRSERDEATGGWLKLHNGKLHNSYYSSDVRMVKSSRVRWVGHVARMGEKTNAYVLAGKPEGKNTYEELGVDGRIILMWIIKNCSRRM
jgi:hypothetical protein